MTVPEPIFGSFGDNVYARFTQVLSIDRATFLPIFLTSLCSACGLVLPG